MDQLNETQIRRYSRQILLREVGGKGQRRLLHSSVSVVGLGPVGASCVVYIAAAGVGQIYLYDEREITPGDVGAGGLYLPEDVGKPRAIVARERLKGLNPDVQIEVSASLPRGLRSIVCGELAAPTKEHEEGARAGLQNGDAVVQLGCLACAPALSDGEGPIDSAFAMLAGALAAYESLRYIVEGTPVLPDSSVLLDSPAMRYQVIKSPCKQK